MATRTRLGRDTEVIEEATVARRWEQRWVDVGPLRAFKWTPAGGAEDAPRAPRPSLALVPASEEEATDLLGLPTANPPEAMDIETSTASKFKFKLKFKAPQGG